MPSVLILLLGVFDFQASKVNSACMEALRYGLLFMILQPHDHLGAWYRLTIYVCHLRMKEEAWFEFAA